MSEYKTKILLKSIRLSFFTGQLILLGLSAYLLFKERELWLYPMGLLALQQLILWAGMMVFNNKID